jgi:chitinase
MIERLRMGILVVIGLIYVSSAGLFAQPSVPLLEADDLRIHALGDSCYVVTTWQTVGGIRYPANSVIIASNEGSVCVDPPWDTTQVQRLISFMDSIGVAPLRYSISTHAHGDRTGGIPAMRSRGIISWASAFTDRLCVEREEPRPDRTFAADTTFTIGSRQLRTMAPGRGHSDDNLVVWVADARILIGGCFVRSTEDAFPGNLSHANVPAWRTSARRLIEAFPHPRVVVPGHNGWTDSTAVYHTAAMMDDWVQKNVWVLGYFKGSVTEAQNLDCTGLSHVVYCFLHLKDGIAALDDSTEHHVLRQLLHHRIQNPNLKVLAAVGGWGGCEPCSDVFATPSGRSTFVSHLARFVRTWKLDGVDIDWETPVLGGYKDHPARPEDRDNLATVLEMLRDSLDDHHILMMDANCDGESLTKAYAWDRILRVVDRVSVMTYSLPNDRKGITGHHTALYSSAFQSASVHSAFQALRSMNIPFDQLLLGAAMYGVVVRDVDSVNLGLGQRGRFDRYATAREIADMERSVSVRFGFDSIAMAPYLYVPSLRQFITTENEASIQRKVDYVLEHSIGGIMVWKINGDTKRQDLLKALHKRMSVEPLSNAPNSRHR